MPLVSVVVPTHNRAAWVTEAVASVLAQEGADVELIIVDDGSSDGTRQALEPFSGRIRYHSQLQRGVAAARNAGARLAGGEWLAFLDSDDLWRPGKLRAQLDFHRENATIPISQTGEIWIRDGRRVNPCKHHEKPRGDIFRASLARCLVTPSAVMMRRALFESAGGFDESLAVCEDYEFWLRLALRVPFGLVDAPLVIKRGGHDDQLSRREWGMDRYRVAALIRLLAAGDLPAERREAVLATVLMKCDILARGACRRGRLDEAERYRQIAAAAASLHLPAQLCEEERTSRFRPPRSRGRTEEVQGSARMR